ncbi:MAG: hypothetical protein JO110_27790, partial [Acetobacteraceae bacterium]|nr:hypothetical protein [Acetobacteraceae bacterium]
MLQAYPGADGLKTGYTEASGCNLVTSAVHSGVRLIGVVLGAASSLERDLHMASLLDAGFEQLDVPAEHPMEVAQLYARAPRLIATAAASPALPLRHGRFAERSRTNRVQLGIPASPGGFGNRKAARAGWSPARRASTEAEFRVQPAKLPGRAGWRAQVSRISDYQLRAGCAGLQRPQGSCSRPQRG